MATKILILGKDYKDRFNNDFLKTSQQDSLAGSSIKKRNWKHG